MVWIMDVKTKQNCSTYRCQSEVLLKNKMKISCKYQDMTREFCTLSVIIAKGLILTSEILQTYDVRCESWLFNFSATKKVTI